MFLDNAQSVRVSPTNIFPLVFPNSSLIEITGYESGETVSLDARSVDLDDVASANPAIPTAAAMIPSTTIVLSITIFPSKGKVLLEGLEPTLFRF